MRISFLLSSKEGIALAKAEIDFIVENEAPTQKNTIEALDFSGYTDRLSSIFFNLNSAETNDEIQKSLRRFLHYYLISVTIFD
jgi:Zn-dependent oligopeptidase